MRLRGAQLFWLRGGGLAFSLLHRDMVCSTLSADVRAVAVESYSEGEMMRAADGSREPLMKARALGLRSHATAQSDGIDDPAPSTSEDLLDRAVETAVERAIFGGNELARRRFLQVVGASAATAIIGSVFPLDTAKALAQEKVKDIEKKDLTVSFIHHLCDPHHHGRTHGILCPARPECHGPPRRWLGGGA